MNKLLDVFDLYYDSNENKIYKFKEKLSSNMDVKIESEKPITEFLWVEKIEDTLIYLENILAAPTRLIINEEEVVKIEKIKKVTVDSIKHLSKNAGFIDEVEENGDVKPGKLLNVFKEETFNTYENRFIYTLIQKIMIIIRKEKIKIIEQSKKDSKELRKFDYKGNSYNGRNKIDIQLVITAETTAPGRTTEVKDVLSRIEILEKRVFSLTLTNTYKALESAKVSLITPPLKKNNVILKNVNFQYAAKLWDFLITEMDKKKETKPEVSTTEYKEKGKAKHFIDETFLLDYLILDTSEFPDYQKRKKEIIEQLIANMVEKTIDVNEQLTEEQLRDLVSKQYKVIKYKHQINGKQIQDIFKKYIGKYVQQVNSRD